MIYIFILLLSLNSVYGKTHVKSLTESMGQEVIELSSPIKAELPPGLEEEPSAEFDDDDTTNTILQIATKRETKKTTTKSPPPEHQTLNSEEEEIKVEKELSEIYKDTDYKSEPSTEEPSSSSATVEVDKPIERSKNNFKFQPDLNNRADVQRFRTSIDEISCDRRVTQRLTVDEKNSTACKLVKSVTIIGTALLSTLVMK